MTRVDASQPVQAVLPSSNRLREAAQQFEAILLGELLKPLGARVSADGNGEQQESGPMESFGLQALAGQIARSGALGLANQMVQSLGHRLQSQAEPESKVSAGRDDR